MATSLIQCPPDSCSDWYQLNGIEITVLLNILRQSGRSHQWQHFIHGDVQFSCGLRRFPEVFITARITCIPVTNAVQEHANMMGSVILVCLTEICQICQWGPAQIFGPDLLLFHSWRDSVITSYCGRGTNIYLHDALTFSLPQYCDLDEI